MKFHLENIGCIEKADIELGNLTIICGHNNTGKTYITYSIYGFLKGLFQSKFRELSHFLNTLDEKDKIITELKEKGKVQIDLEVFEKYKNSFIKILGESYSKQLHEVFSCNVEEFIESKFSINLDKLIHFEDAYKRDRETVQIIKEEGSSVVTVTQDSDDEKQIDKSFRSIIFHYFLFDNFPIPFITTAERTGIQLFQKELDKKRSDLIALLTKTSSSDLTRDSFFELLTNEIARFALPTEDEIDFTRDQKNISKSNSYLKYRNQELTTYIEEMSNIRYEIVDDKTVVVIDKNTNRAIPLYLASTSVRSLFDLHLWLKHRANKWDILFIDEPELNLHPANQRKMARLFVKLINNGIKVFITTHSDYIIKELNNLLMFHNDFPRKTELMKKFNITKDTILNPKDLKAYIAHDGTVSQVDIDEYGMVQSGFDDAIVQINEESDKIAFAINEK